MQTGNCKLCGQFAKLEHSHVIPSFVFRWFKKTSATRHMRSGIKPNQRQQDGWKYYWLCPSCEDLLNNWETKFSNDVFYPFVECRKDSTDYGSWMLKFAVSLSWRAAQMHLERSNLHLNKDMESHQAKLLAAMAKWKSFLLGEIPHPGEFEQHFLHLRSIEYPTNTPLPHNINRYLLRTIDIDMPFTSVEYVTYVKFGPFLFL